MQPIFVGIAGGTGAGKSTVCFSLVDKYPKKITIVHLDDYHKTKDQVPTLYGMTNWDHPDAINFDQLLQNLQELKNGKTIVVQTKNERFNPRAKEIGRLPIDISPKAIILVEGYLVLWNPKVRELLNYKIFLDAPYEVRIKRRTKFMDDVYREKILIPMHAQYVEPTKKYADYVIDAKHLSKEQMYKNLIRLKPFCSLSSQ